MAEVLPRAPAFMSFGLFSSRRALKVCKGHFAHSPEHAVPQELSCLHPQAVCPCPALQWPCLAGRHRSHLAADTDLPGSLQPFLGPCGWAGHCRWKHRVVTVAGHCSEQLEGWQWVVAGDSAIVVWFGVLFLVRNMKCRGARVPWWEKGCAVAQHKCSMQEFTGQHHARIRAC